MERVHAKPFLDFEWPKWGKRSVRKVSPGVLTLGDAPAPLNEYHVIELLGPSQREGYILAKPADMRDIFGRLAGDSFDLIIRR